MVQVKIESLLDLLEDDQQVLNLIGFDHASAMVFVPGEGDFIGKATYRRQGESDWSSFEAYQRDLGEGYAVQWIYDIGGLGEAVIVKTNGDPRVVFEDFIRFVAKDHSGTFIAGELGEVEIQG